MSKSKTETQLEAAGLSPETIQKAKGAGFTLAKLRDLVIKYGPKALQILQAILALIPDQPAPAAAMKAPKRKPKT